MAYYIELSGTGEVIDSNNQYSSDPANKKLYATESAANSALSSLGDSNLSVKSEWEVSINF